MHDLITNLSLPLLNNMIWFFQVGFLVRSKVKKKTLLFDVTTTISLGQLLKQEDQCSAAAFATTTTKKRLPFMIGHKSTLFLDRNRPFFWSYVVRRSFSEQF